MTERWVSILNDRYEVSDLGRVRSWFLAGSRTGRKTNDPRIIKQSRSGSPYPAVWLIKEKGAVGEKFRVHRLVCEAFHGPPQPGEEVRHINGDPEDNRADNLMWGTSCENKADMERHGTRLKGEKHNMARLAESDVLAIRRSQEHNAILAERYGVARQTINDIKARRRWAHLSEVA